MTDKELVDLILYIIDQVEDLGGYTTTIRLVKFLYLIDLEHYRRYGRQLTNLNWIFYHYGPYAFSLPSIGKRLGFDLEQEEFRTKAGKEGKLFKVWEHRDPPESLGYAVISFINRLLRIWADQETSELLLYVYKTEPIRQGIRGEELDFKKASMGSKYYELYIPVDKKAVKRIKENLQTYQKKESEELVSPVLHPTIQVHEVMQKLGEDEAISDFPGLFPGISDENELWDTLPGED